MSKQLITHSRMSCFKTCRRKHYFAYEVGLQREADSAALRMGSAFHEAIEAFAHGDYYGGYQCVHRAYDGLPDSDIERETVLRICTGYQWYWEASGVEYLECEREFAIALRNPETDLASRNWLHAGKIDGIVRIEDGRLLVIEHKLLSEDLSADSPLWRRLQIDSQISLYVHAARQLGYEVDGVLYDVARKPTIRPTNEPVLDDDGYKIVLNTDGDRVWLANGKPRQSGDASQGWSLVTRPQSPDEWGDRLTADISSRPDWYFQRREIARLDKDIEEIREELWQISKTLRDAQLNNRHYRTVSRDTCAWCQYFGPCTTGWQSSDAPPDGFTVSSDIHRELELSNASDYQPTS